MAFGIFLGIAEVSRKSTFYTLPVHSISQYKQMVILGSLTDNCTNASCTTQTLQNKPTLKCNSGIGGTTF